MSRQNHQSGWGTVSGDIISAIVSCGGPRTLLKFAQLNKELRQKVLAVRETMILLYGAGVPPLEDVNQYYRDICVAFETAKNAANGHCRARTLLSTTNLREFFVMRVAGSQVTAVRVYNNVRGSYGDVEFQEAFVCDLWDTPSAATPVYPKTRTILVHCGAQIASVPTNALYQAEEWHAVTFMKFDSYTRRMTPVPKSKRLDSIGIPLVFPNMDKNFSSVAIVSTSQKRAYVMDFETGQVAHRFPVASIWAESRGTNLFYQDMLVLPYNEGIVLHNLKKLVKSREGGGGRFPEQRQVPLVSGRPAFLATDGADVAIITVPTRSLYAECDATLIELHLIECETASVRCSRSKLTKQTLPIDTRDMPGATVAIDSKFVYASLGRFVQVYSRRNLELLSEVYVGFHDRYTTRFLHSFGVGKLLVATASHAVVLDFTPEFDTQSRKGLVVSPNGQLVQVDYQETQWHLVAQKQLGALEILTRAVTAKGRGTDVRYILAYQAEQNEDQMYHTAFNIPNLCLEYCSHGMPYVVPRRNDQPIADGGYLGLLPNINVNRGRATPQAEGNGLQLRGPVLVLKHSVGKDGSYRCDDMSAEEFRRVFIKREIFTERAAQRSSSES